MNPSPASTGSIGDPWVTVILPCFNREAFIRDTLESALNQTYPRINIIAVDDGSTDGTRAILSAYAGRITILEQPGRANRGQSAAINLALRSSVSPYVAILDSDDLWAPEKVERQVRFLESHPEVGLVYANGLAIDDKGNILYRILPPDHVETNEPERVLLSSYFNLPSNALVRRSVLDLAGEFDETLRSAQDHDMAIRIAEVTTLAYLNETLWYYRRHNQTQSFQHTRRRWEMGFRILYKACKRRHYGLDVRRRRLALLYFRLGQCLAAERRFVRAGVRFALAGLLDPFRAGRVLLGLEPRTSPH